MGADPPVLGKGLFGYRKSSVNQLLSDRDVMIRQAEGRVRASESKVAELQGELAILRDRNARTEEQLDRLRVQLNTLIAHGGTSYEAAAEAVAVEPSAGLATEGQLQPTQETAEDMEGTRQGEEAVTQPWQAEVGSEAPQVAVSDSTLGATEQPSAPGSESQDQPWAVQETGEASGEAAQPAEPPTSGSITEPAGEEQAAQAGAPGYDPGYDADAFGYHGNYPPGEDETPYGYRYDWPAEATATPAPADESAESIGTVAPEPMEEPQPETSSGLEQTPQHVAAGSASRFVTEELAGILSVAEESAARIVDRAQETADRQIERSNRMWNEVQAEVARFAAWRDEVEPVIRTVQSKVDNVRAFIEVVPERIREALAPMAESISSIDTDLAELSAACNPPLLLAPSATQSEGEDGSSGENASSEEDRPSSPDARSTEPSDPFGGPSFGYSAS